MQHIGDDFSWKISCAELVVGLNSIRQEILIKVGGYISYIEYKHNTTQLLYEYIKPNFPPINISPTMEAPSMCPHI